jgi:ABC-type multidrug transport system ATPase subunit
MIHLSDIVMTYGDRPVLDIPALTLEEGRRYAVMGANGSGKSTLLRILAGTLAPTGGAVYMAAETALDRGYMPQHPYIFSFSVLKNVTMALERNTEAKDAALEALKAVGMDAFLTARGKSLSGGEAQRVAIARLIARPRKLLILDEPTSSTDIAGNDLVEAALRTYCAKSGCTLLFSTHAPAQAMRLSDRVIMLHEGRVVENGPTEEVLSKPASPQGEDFLRHWKI